MAFKIHAHKLNWKKTQTFIVMYDHAFRLCNLQIMILNSINKCMNVIPSRQNMTQKYDIALAANHIPDHNESQGQVHRNFWTTF